MWVLDSNCSLLFLSIWGDLRTVYLSILVGKGIGPLTCAPVLLAVFTISIVDNVTRVGKNLQEKLLSFRGIKKVEWDNKKSLQIALDTINERLKDLVE